MPEAITTLLLRWNKFQGQRVDTEPQPGWSGTILKHMAKVRITTVAEHLRPVHAEATVRFFANVLFRNWLEKTRPARSGFELRVGGEEIVIAADAPVNARLVVVPVRTAAGQFCSLSPSNPELFWRENLLPLIVCLHNLFDHDVSSLCS